MKFDIAQTVDIPDATSMSSGGWHEYIACLKGASGTLTCIGAKPNPEGGPTSATFKTKATGGYNIAGNIIIQKTTVGTPVDEKVTFDVSFVFTGTITVT